MSRKHYNEAARILRETPMAAELRAQLVSRFVSMFADDNARFSPTRFRDACEPVSSCTTCGRPADNGYVNQRAGERCVDPVHEGSRAA